MRVFISWSGSRSEYFAVALRQWLRDVNSMIDAWVSAADIEAGERWGAAVDQQLSQTSVGILCLTRENCTAPWMLFEAGALAKAVSSARVCPLLIDLEPTDIPAGPLTRFQAKGANRAGVFDVLNTINHAMEQGRLSDGQLARVFERWWPDLDKAIRAIPPPAQAPVERPSDDMLKEVLEHVRTLVRQTVPEIPIPEIEYDFGAEDEPGESEMAKAFRRAMQKKRT